MKHRTSRISFIPFQHAMLHERSEVKRPSPLLDQAQFNNVSDYAMILPKAPPRAGNSHPVYGGNSHVIYGGNSHPCYGTNLYPCPDEAAIPTPNVSAGLGYHPDLADLRDFVAFGKIQRPNGLRNFVGVAHQHVKVGTSTGGAILSVGALPSRYHIADDGGTPLSPIEDQGNLQSCTANAVIGIVEYMVRRYSGEMDDFSRMFLYKTTRRLMGMTGDTGAYIRQAIKALRLFGVPPESEWPYDPALLDREPDAYQYSYAQNYKTLKYERFDGYGAPAGSELLDNLKLTIANNLPFAFGFPVYDSINNLQNWVIPIPTQQDKLVGGHAVAAVGYDDSVKVAGQDKEGALIIRNSWGIGWGDVGYAYLPYDYVLKGWAMDFWAIFDDQWLKAGYFDDADH